VSIFFSTCTEIVSGSAKSNDIRAITNMIHKMIQMIGIGNGITNAKIALHSTTPIDSKLSLKEINFPASSLGALDNTYAFTPGPKNNRPKLLAKSVRINTRVVN
jgi:hypothetical protein